MKIQPAKLAFGVAFVITSLTVCIATLPDALPMDKPEISVHTAVTTTPPVSSHKGGKATSENTEKVIDYPIDLNNATREELMSLDGIGEVLADRIIAFRLSGNVFRSVEDIVLIEGIGDATFRKNADRIFVSGEYTEPPQETIPTSITAVTEETTVPATETATIHTTVLTTETTTATTTVTEMTTTPETTTTAKKTTNRETTIEEREPVPVNLNTCDFDDLMTLPISERQALAILELREKIDYFSDPLELILADGIDYETYNRISEYVYV